MNKRFELILHEVNRKFRSERAFYHSTLGITQRAWEKYKSGETDFSNVKLSIYSRMIDSLFTRYEAMLIDQAIDAVNYNWYENIVEAFHDIKLIHVKAMLERGASIEQAGAIMDDGRDLKYNSIAQIRIVDEVDLKNVNRVSFQIQIPSSRPEHLQLRPPSGKRNRREWFDKHFEEVVVK